MSARSNKWYRLSGKSEQAMLRVLDITQQKETISEEERMELAKTLGQLFPVRQTVTWFGPKEDYAVFPAIFGHPYSKDGEFYMTCPIGSQKDKTETSFEPEDAVLLSEEEAIRLEQALFPPQGASLPIIERQPIPLEPKPATKQNPLSPGPKLN